MYFIMSDHDVVGPSMLFLRVCPVVKPVTQITNNVTALPFHTQDNRNIPLGIHTSKGGGGGACWPYQTQITLVQGGTKQVKVDQVGSG